MECILGAGQQLTTSYVTASDSLWAREPYYGIALANLRVVAALCTKDEVIALASAACAPSSVTRSLVSFLGPSNDVAAISSAATDI